MLHKNNSCTQLNSTLVHKQKLNTRARNLALHPSLPHSLFLFLVSIIITCLLIPQKAAAQLSTPELSFETYGVVSSSGSTPFWHRSQREGMVAWEGSQSITRFQVHGTETVWDSPIGFEYGADLAGRFMSDNALYFNQLYGRITFGKLYLAGGRFSQTVGKTHETLTSGSMGISNNAVPIPRIQAGLSDYIAVPFTYDFVEIKGYIAHGWLESSRYVESPWLHEKSGYARFGHNHSRFSVYGGLSHFGLWGGNSPRHGELPTGWRNFARIFFVTGADSETDDNIPFGWDQYAFGNSKGIWDFGATFEHQNYTIQLYRHIPIENRSSLKLNSAQDGLYGISVNRKRSQSLLTDIAYEFLYTKWQNGPDGPGSRATGKAGWINYYNSGVYLSGWTYHAQTIGSPLLSPSRGEIGPDSDSRYRIDNNRVVGHHVGISGFLNESIRYRTFLTYTRNYGTYWDRERSDNFQFEGGPEQVSGLFEISVDSFFTPQLDFNISAAFDIGELYNNGIGLMIGASYRL